MISDIYPQQKPQLSLFDKPLVEKNRAMAQVDSNADDEFKRVGMKTIETYAKNCPELHANDIWQSLDQLGVTTHDNRALGPLFRRAANAGWIEKTNRTMASDRVSRHGGDVRIWRSLLYKPTSST